MSKHPPGSKDWWIETALIAAGGVALAAWLWDGPLADRAALMEAAQEAPAPPRSYTLGDLFDEGCMSAEALAALRDGRNFRVYCPETDARPQAPQGPPPQNRPFP